jgi:hypothetical protein
MNENKKQPIYIHCPDARSKYDGKGVAFGYEIDGKIKSLSGKFIVHGHGQKAWIDVEYLGPLSSFPPPKTLGYYIQLTQQHFDSIIALPAPDSEVVYMIQRPFLSRRCTQEPSDRRP